MLPADQIEALERLVDEVERVSAVGEGAIRLGREQKVSERGWRGAGSDGGEHGALGRLPMAYRRPTPQPALEGREIRRARERRTLLARRLPFAVGRDAAGAVEQGEIVLLLGEHGQEIAERGEDGQPHAPAVTVARAEQHDLPDDVRRWHVGREFALHRLGDDKAEVVGETVVESPAPMRGRVSVAEGRLHPNLQVTHFDGTGRHVVGPQIEGAAARKIEAGVVPVAGQDTVLDAAAVERKAHVRTAIVERENAPVGVDDEDRTMRPTHDEPPLRLQLLKAARAHEIRGWNIHGRSCPVIVRCGATGGYCSSTAFPLDGLTTIRWALSAAPPRPTPSPNGRGA